MSEFTQAILVTSGFRCIALVVGLAFGYFGYKLFAMGVFQKAGELKTVWGDRRLVLKQAAPGTFFALFGTVVVTVTLIQGIDIERRSGSIRVLAQEQVLDRIPIQDAAAKIREKLRTVLN